MRNKSRFIFLTKGFLGLAIVLAISVSEFAPASAAGTSYSGGNVSGPGGVTLPITRVVTVGDKGAVVVIPTEFGMMKFTIPPHTFANSTQLVLANALSAFKVPAPGKSAVASFFIAIYKNGIKIDGDFQNPLSVDMEIPFVHRGDSVYVRTDGGWERLQTAVIRDGHVHFEITSDPVITVLGRTGSQHPIVLPGTFSPQVALLQKYLVRRGLPVVVDGIYGSETKGAVVAFQVQSKLRGNGVVGPRTWAMLMRVAPNAYPKIGVGSDSDAVYTLRRLLQQRGYKIGNQGIFDMKLANAVKLFQERQGITPTGVVKRSTWLKLGVQ